jgi:hypothetical protein
VLDLVNSWKKGKINSIPSSGSGEQPSAQALDPFPDLSPTLWEGKARKIALTLRDPGILTATRTAPSARISLSPGSRRQALFIALWRFQASFHLLDKSELLNFPRMN